MEGTLQVPPDRGTIIGRALWKTRYVVIGGATRELQTDSPRSQGFSSSVRGSAQRIQPKGLTIEPTHLTIYKSKDELDPVQQHSISLITDVQVQMVAHRKQGPVLPTLVLAVSPDPAADKLRKRRSSRTAGLTSSKDPSPNTLWFRAGQSPDDTHTLHDWARCLQQLIQPNMPDRTPMSPITPASPTFINPFSPRQREMSDAYQRPPSGHVASRAPMQHKGSNQTQSTASRDRAVTYSESHSLRSKRSDLSSQASSMMKNPLQMAYPNYQSMHPADLPSPAATVEEYQGEFIEGWTSAQGRSSTLSSPIRARDSFGSQIPAPTLPSIDSSSPPGPRETILDRAFQIGYIPGSDRRVPGEEKLSSLARFDALMREADEKRRIRESQEAKQKPAAAAPKTTGQDGGLKSAWDIDDDSDDSDVGEPHNLPDDDDSDGLALEGDLSDRFVVSPKAQRALNFVTARSDSISGSAAAMAQGGYGAGGPREFNRSYSQGVRPPPRYNQETLMTLSLNSGSSTLRPQTGYSTRNRPGFAQRTHSQPQLAGNAMVASLINAASGSAAREAQAASAADSTILGKTVEEDGICPTATGTGTTSASTGITGTASAAAAPIMTAAMTLGTSLHRSATEKRHSASSTKRLSFTEFTKRLSSTSSLLLAPASGAGSRHSSDADSQLTATNLSSLQQPSKTAMQPRGAGIPPPPPPGASERDREAWEKRCGWRGSVGVFGAEGGFL